MEGRSLSDYDMYYFCVYLLAISLVINICFEKCILLYLCNVIWNSCVEMDWKWKEEKKVRRNQAWKRSHGWKRSSHKAYYLRLQHVYLKVDQFRYRIMVCNAWLLKKILDKQRVLDSLVLGSFNLFFYWNVSSNISVLPYAFMTHGLNKEKDGWLIYHV